MSQVTVQHKVILSTIECYSCGVIFGIPTELDDNLRNNHRVFYCPHGHNQAYVGKTEAEKLREKLEQEQKKLANAQFELMAEKQRAESAEKSKERLQKRIKNGACPCCHRQFTQLTRHMKSKHPEYSDNSK